MSRVVLIVALMVASFNLNAKDLISGDFEYNYWKTSYDLDKSIGGIKSNAYFLKASVEFQKISMPNYAYSALSVDGEEFSYIQDNINLYYETYKKDGLIFDAGIGLTKLSNGKHYEDEFDGYLPTIYIGLEKSFPDLDFVLFSTLNYSRITAAKITDLNLGVRYSIKILRSKLGIQSGYRYNLMDLNSFDAIKSKIKSDGFYFGLNFSF
jgi:outer membrane protein